MSNTKNGFKADGNYWLRHCGSWFAFPHAAHFVEHPDGGFFADDSGAQIYSTAQAKHPPEEARKMRYVGQCDKFRSTPENERFWSDMMMTRQAIGLDEFMSLVGGSIPFLDDGETFADFIEVHSSQGDFGLFKSKNGAVFVQSAGFEFIWIEVQQ